MPDEFDARFRPLFDEAGRMSGHADTFSADYFFPYWRKLMGLKLARTWETPGAALGALFVPETFTGLPTALVVFWWSLPEGRKGGASLQLLDAVEAVAREEKCAGLYVAGQVKMRREAMARLYRRKGFTEVESVFRKLL
jgi:GNAT superfamily N-acetyltransferase